MASSLFFKYVGILLVIAGVVFVSNPELVSSKPIPQDIFAAIERRVWWGLLIGVGVLFLFHHQLQPWLATLAATGAALTFGLLAARLMGIALDGSVAKQWFWVAVEAVILAGLVYWYRELRR